MSQSCERLWEVDAFREGRLDGTDAESFLRHRESCAECRRRFVDDERLGALGRALPVASVDPLHARRLRQAILREAANIEKPARSRLFYYVAPLVAAALVVAGLGGARWYAQRNLIPPSLNVGAPETSVIQRPFGATVDPEAGAAWITETVGRTEHVKLSAGALSLTVRHREAGERFLVDLPDGEIEVRGTQFRVDVEGGVTRSVHVIEGLVALRRFGAREVLIGANESWGADAASAVDGTPQSAAAPGSQSAAPPPPPATANGSAPGNTSARPSVGRASSKASTTPEETAEYDAAVALYASQHYEDAARRLHAFAAAYPARAEAEDAAFLEASALAHVGRTDAAGVVAERFLDRYPTSLHASDAATLAVRAARSRGDCAHARLVARGIPEERARAAALGLCASP